MATPKLQGKPHTRQACTMAPAAISSGFILFTVLLGGLVVFRTQMAVPATYQAPTLFILFPFLAGALALATLLLHRPSAELGAEAMESELDKESRSHQKTSFDELTLAYLPAFFLQHIAIMGLAVAGALPAILTGDMRFYLIPALLAVALLAFSFPTPNHILSGITPHLSRSRRLMRVSWRRKRRGLTKRLNPLWNRS